jgi:hypothetical protein
MSDEPLDGPHNASSSPVDYGCHDSAHGRGFQERGRSVERYMRSLA